MKVLLIEVGGVGEASAMLAQNRPWPEHMVLAHYNLKRAKVVRARLGTGVKGGTHRKVYINEVTNNQESMKNYGCQIVSYRLLCQPAMVSGDQPWNCRRKTRGMQRVFTDLKQLIHIRSCKK